MVDPNDNESMKQIDRNEQIIEYISFVAIFLTGFVMVLIRTFDPFYKFLIQRSVYEYFGFIKDEPEEGIKAQVLSSFLASSLNIELVYIILVGITRFSNEQQTIQNNQKEAIEKDDDNLDTADQ